MANGLGVAWIRCPLTAANIIAQEGILRVEWCRARAELLPARPLQCFKCLEGGHVRAHCPNNIDRSETCYRYGVLGHRARDCESKLSPLCGTRSTCETPCRKRQMCTLSHKVSGRMSRVYQTTRKVPRNSDPPSSQRMETTPELIDTVLESPITTQSSAVPRKTPSPTHSSVMLTINRRVEDAPANIEEGGLQDTLSASPTLTPLPQRERERKGPMIRSIEMVCPATRVPSLTTDQPEKEELEYGMEGDMQVSWEETKLEERPDKRRVLVEEDPAESDEEQVVGGKKGRTRAEDPIDISSP